MVSKFILSAFQILDTFLSIPFYSSLSFHLSFSLVWHDSQHMKSSISTQDPDATHHQQSLKTATKTFLSAMRSNEHKLSKYQNFLKDVKFILDGHVTDLTECAPSAVMKQILATMRDPNCKYLGPKESTTESSDEDFPTQFTHLVEEQIFGEFPVDILTPEVQN